VFAGMTVKSSVYIPYFLAVSIPAAAYYIYLIFRWEIVWKRQWNEMDMLKIKNPLYIIMCICMLGASVFFFIKEEKSAGPEKALNYISENPVPGNIFHPHKWGGYMEFYLYPAYKIMTAPGRDVPEETMEEYKTIKKMSAGAPKLIKKYNINTFMLPDYEHEIILKLKKAGYKTAYFDETAAIMVNDKKTDRYFKNIRPFDSEKIYDGSDPDDALEELSVFLEKYPSVKGYLMLARLYGEKNISDRIIFLEDIVEKNDDEELIKELARVYLEAGEYEAAADIVRKISFFDSEARGILKEAREMRRAEEQPVEDE
ncbi:MAG: tetratricopeptide repeat protein, partial [bacterium]